MSSSKQRMILAPFMICLFVMASLSGCFGEDDLPSFEAEELLLIGGQKAEQSMMKKGEIHDFILSGTDMKMTTTQADVLFFINGSIVPSGIVTTGDQEVTSGLILTTPYTEQVVLEVMNNQGQTSIINVAIENGTPIVNGEDWYEKMEFITSVCACLLYTSPSPRDQRGSRMPSSA